MTKDDVMDDSGLDREALKLMAEVGAEAGKMLCPPSGNGFWMRPLGDMLIVRQAKKKRARSVLIAEAETREMPWEGTVVAVSSKAAEAGIALEDVVLFSRHAGQEGITPLGYDDTYVLLHTDEILAILDEAALAAQEEAYRKREEAARADVEALRRQVLDRQG